MHHWPKRGDVAHLLVDDFFREPEARDLAADHAASLLVRIKDVDLIAQWSEVPGDGQRSWPGADARDLLAIGRGDLGQQCRYVRLVVGGHPFQAADRHRFLFDPSSPASRLAWPVARPPQDSREDVRLPVDHVGVGIAPVRDQADVFGHWRVRGTSPLAIDNFVKVIRTTDVRRLQRTPPSSGVTDIVDPRLCCPGVLFAVAITLCRSREHVRVGLYTEAEGSPLRKTTLLPRKQTSTGDAAYSAGLLDDPRRTTSVHPGWRTNARTAVQRP